MHWNLVKLEHERIRAGFFCIFLQFSRISLDFPGFPWIILDFTGFPWISLDLPVLSGFTWISLDLPGFFRISLDLPGFPWISLHITGFHWFALVSPYISLDFPGFLCCSQEVTWIPKSSLEFPGISSPFLKGLAGKQLVDVRRLNRSKVPKSSQLLERICQYTVLPSSATSSRLYTVHNTETRHKKVEK